MVFVLKNDVNVPSTKLLFVGILKVNNEKSRTWSRIRIPIRIGIHKYMVWVGGSGSRSLPKCHGSGTVVLDNDFTTVKSMAVLIDNPKSHLTGFAKLNRMR